MTAQHSKLPITADYLRHCNFDTPPMALLFLIACNRNEFLDCFFSGEAYHVFLHKDVRA